jgi:hypothetical protein
MKGLIMAESLRRVNPTMFGGDSSKIGCLRLNLCFSLLTKVNRLDQQKDCCRGDL